MGFASDWHPYQKDLEKFPGDTLLLIFDPERVYSEKFCMPIKMNAFEREKERIEARRQEVLDEHEASLRKVKGGGGGGEDGEAEDEPEENIVVRDEPRVGGEDGEAEDEPE